MLAVNTVLSESHSVAGDERPVTRSGSVELRRRRLAISLMVCQPASIRRLLSFVALIACTQRRMNRVPQSLHICQVLQNSHGRCQIFTSINQSINLYRAIVQRRVLQRGYAASKRNVLRLILNVLTDGAVRQFSGREFQSLGAATEKRRAAVFKLCGGTDRSFCVNDRSKRD